MNGIKQKNSRRGGGNSEKPSVTKVLRALGFELLRKICHTERQRSIYANGINHAILRFTQNDITSCPPLAGGPKSLISRWGKTIGHAERSEFENRHSANTSTQRGEFTPSLIREGRDGFQPLRENSEQLAPTSILPHKGGATHVAHCNNFHPYLWYWYSHSEGNIHLTPKNLIKNNQIDLSLTAQDDVGISGNKKNGTCHTERQRKYPVTNTKELSCNNVNYVAMNKKLDCFGSVEPHNDVNKSSELFNNFNTPFLEKDFSRFTEPSRGMSEAKVEQTSTETLSFRCVCERCRLMRGDVNNKSRKVVFTITEGATHVAHSDNSRKVAFTLAEVLITLGIIGIIAALTLPNLIANYQEKVAVARLKKFYSTISNAYISILNEEGDPTQWENIESWEDVSDKFVKHIVKAKHCRYRLDGQPNGGCFATVRRLDLTGDKVDSVGYYESIVLADGTVFGFDAQTGLQTALQCKSLLYCFNIVVDINGDKKPNQWGVDTFTFHVGKNKILPRGAANTHGRQLMCKPTGYKAAGWWNGSGCGAWVIYNENMDYLKCVKGNQKYCEQNYYF